MSIFLVTAKLGLILTSVNPLFESRMVGEHYKFCLYKVRTSTGHKSENLLELNINNTSTRRTNER